MRGAANAVFSTPEPERQNGFATHSSGNHGQAVARAAQLAGVPAYIVMPENANPKKIAAVKSYGAQITFCEPNDQSRQETCDQILDQTGAAFIHPFDDYRVIAGQATAAAELVEEVAKLDFVGCPIGGGGLSSGTALTLKYFSPQTRLIGSEPENVNDAYLSLKAGAITRGHPQPTIADGLRTLIGQKPFEILREEIQEIVTVSEEDIVKALALVMERMKLIIEPSCAVPVAALLKTAEHYKNRRVGIILTGGNLDLTNLLAIQ